MKAQIRVLRDSHGSTWIPHDGVSVWSVGKKEFSKKLSKISLPSVGVVCANEPPAVMSRSRADFMSKPE